MFENKKEKKTKFIYWTTQQECTLFVRVCVCEIGWVSERVSLLTIQFWKLKSTYLEVEASGYTLQCNTLFTYFIYSFFVYCTCAKLNLSPTQMPRRDFIAVPYMFCAHVCVFVCAHQKDPFCPTPILTAKTHIVISYTLRMW